MNDNKGTLILILGILGLTGCALMAPVAWFMGNQYRRECIVEGREPDSMANVGRILGMVGTGMFALGLVCAGAMIILQVVVVAGTGGF